MSEIDLDLTGEAAVTDKRDDFNLLEVVEGNVVVTAAEQSVTKAVAVSDITTMATQLGYEGELTLGALEDGVRFYQAQTVAAALNMGKCLLLIKEMTPHGEFAKRLELLGYSDRTANRFMSAALKVSKSANLADLSKRIKATSVLLELITQDDGTLKTVGEMDDLDTLTASQMRQRLRDIEQNGREEENKLHDKLNRTASELELAKAELATFTRTKKPTDGTYNARTFEVRHEAAALGYGAKVHTDALNAMLHNINNDGATPTEQALRHKAIALAISGVYAEAQQLYAQAKEMLGDDLIIEPSSTLMLTEAEQTSLAASVTMIDHQFSHKAEDRKTERRIEAPPRAGRPEGSKNKNKGEE